MPATLIKAASDMWREAADDADFTPGVLALRKNRALGLYDNGLSPDRICNQMGWIPGSLMIQTYIRGSGTSLFEPQKTSPYAMLAKRVESQALSPDQMADVEQWQQLRRRQEEEAPQEAPQRESETSSNDSSGGSSSEED